MNNSGRGLVVAVIVLAVVCVVFLAAGFMILNAWGGFEWWNEIPDRVKNVEEFSINETKKADVSDFSKFEFDSVSADMDVMFADTDEITVNLAGSYRSGRGKIQLKKQEVGNKVRFYVDYPKNSGLFTWNETELTITMPMDMDGKDLNFGTVSGDVRIPGGLDVDGINVNTTSGDVRIDEVKCDKVVMGTVSGRTDVRGYVADGIKVNTVSGDADIRLNGTTGSIDTDGVSGDVEIILDKNVDFTFDFDTVSGDFDCDFPVYTKGGKTDQSGYTDEGADMDITVNTVSGDLTIRN